MRTKDHIKLMFVGDSGVGKTSFIVSHVNDERCVGGYIPNVYENYTKKVVIYGKTLLIDYLDTAGNDEYDQIRP